MLSVVSHSYSYTTSMCIPNESQSILQTASSE